MIRDRRAAHVDVIIDTPAHRSLIADCVYSGVVGGKGAYGPTRDHPGTDPAGDDDDTLDSEGGGRTTSGPQWQGALAANMQCLYAMCVQYLYAMCVCIIYLQC